MDIPTIIEMLSSKKVLVRKEAIKLLKSRLCSRDAYMARLALHYVSEHDPCYTVRNVARQAFYRISAPPDDSSWEKHYIFRSE